MGNNIRGERDAGLVASAVASADAVSPADAGGVKVLAKAFDVVSHVGNRESRLNSLISGPVIVEVDKSSCLKAGVVIGGKGYRGVFGWLKRNGEDLIIKGLDVTTANRA